LNHLKRSSDEIIISRLRSDVETVQNRLISFVLDLTHPFAS
jgi:hypothetical protein